jgi:TetR/AcrR family transcriptional regulator, transcriptional repressor for nem operon
MNTAAAAEMRQHILDTAMPILLGKGFTAVGLSEILAAAGVPKGSFYHYFGSKEAFGEALLASYFTAYVERLEDLLQRQPGTAAERLMRYWNDWCATQCADDPAGKCLTVKLGAEVCDLSEPMRVALQRGTEQIVARLAACIEAGREDGTLAAVSDVAATASSLYELWLGATLLQKIRHDGRPLEAAMTTTRRLLGLPPGG